MSCLHKDAKAVASLNLVDSEPVQVLCMQIFGSIRAKIAGGCDSSERMDAGLMLLLLS